jgi:hypothetical protein
MIRDQVNPIQFPSVVSDSPNAVEPNNASPMPRFGLRGVELDRRDRVAGLVGDSDHGNLATVILRRHRLGSRSFRGSGAVTWGSRAVRAGFGH